MQGDNSFLEVFFCFRTHALVLLGVRGVCSIRLQVCAKNVVFRSRIANWVETLWRGTVFKICDLMCADSGPSTINQSTHFLVASLSTASKMAFLFSTPFQSNRLVLFSLLLGLVYAPHRCPMPVCDSCLSAQVHDAPGIGFDLTTSYA